MGPAQSRGTEYILDFQVVKIEGIDVSVQISQTRRSKLRNRRQQLKRSVCCVPYPLRLQNLIRVAENAK